MPTPLDRLRVIDLTSGPVGGVATMVLADFGADVVKVERPGGDPFRILPSAPVWLRGKRSVVLDLKTEAGRAHLARLAAGADLVLTTGTEARLRALGADHETLAEANPAIVTCAITGFGTTGPYAEYPGYEGVVAAKAGRMASFAGLTHREGPHFAALQVASHAAAFAAAFGSIAALIARDRTGQGQHVDTSLLQGLSAYDLVSLAHTSVKEREPERYAEPPIPVLAMPTLNYHPVMTKDGVWLQLGNLLQHLFDNYLVAADFADIFGDGEHEGAPSTWPEATREAFRDRMLLRMRERTADEWMRTFIEHGGVAAHRYQSTQQALDDPDLVANGHVIETPHPVDATKPPMRQIGMIARLTGTPGDVRPAFPAVGEHSEEILGALAAAPSSAERVRAGGEGSRAAGRPPLDGITVLDFSTIIAAPLAATHLADLGARVIKIEQVGGDPWRWMYQGFGFMKTNAGKESIALDLKSEAGRAIAHALIAKADVVIHNYRPGVPERLGIGYEDARAITPNIVYVSANGYGLAGPGAHRPATHPIPGAALGGAVWQAGVMPTGTSLDALREGARRLSRANEVNPDPNTSAVIATATLLALWHRHRTGEGQQVFTDMLGANAWANLDDFFSYEGREARPPVDADVLGTGPLYRLYRCHEGWVFLGVLLDAEWDRLCAAIGRPDLHAHPHFATREARAAHADALTAALTEVFATRDAYWWEASLTSRGVGCVRADGPLPGDFWHTAPHVTANGFVSSVTHFDHGPYERYRAIARIRGSERQYAPAPVGGEHAGALLRELGYEDDAIAALRAAGVVWSEPQVLERRT
ncbi:MAG: CoA transferase [Chloroflexi bacterium]|nr:CoA transferase [Chloroflexota bacterium]